MKVIDASVVYHLVLNTDRAPSIVAHLDDHLFAPDLLVTELVERVRRLVSGRVVTAKRAAVAMEVLREMDVEYLHVWPYLTRLWELHPNVTAFDACYVALAEDLGCPLVTADARLARAPGLRVPVLVV